MAHMLNLPNSSRLAFDRMGATIRAIPRAVAAEHTLAMRAANKAALPRQCLREVQAMYVSSAPSQDSDLADGALK